MLHLLFNFLMRGSIVTINTVSNIYFAYNMYNITFITIKVYQ